MTNPWITFVKKFAERNGLTYGESLKLAGRYYKKQSQGGVLVGGANKKKLMKRKEKPMKRKVKRGGVLVGGADEDERPKAYVKTKEDKRNEREMRKLGGKKRLSTRSEYTRQQAKKLVEDLPPISQLKKNEKLNIIRASRDIGCVKEFSGRTTAELDPYVRSAIRKIRRSTADIEGGYLNYMNYPIYGGVPVAGSMRQAKLPSIRKPILRHPMKQTKPVLKNIRVFN